MTSDSQQAGVLQVRGVTKRYGLTAALTEISLSVAAGEVVALAGHNGAGKTTLLRLILGLTRPTSGLIAIDDAPPGSAAARRQCAYLPEVVTFRTALTGCEQLRMFARLKGMDDATVTAALERVGLAHAAAWRIATYSRGMRQRLGLAQALLGRPRLLLLDEPTGGLDPESRQHFYQLVGELARAGTATVLSSHALDEVGEHVDRLIILRTGQMLANDTPDRLRAQSTLPTIIRLRVQRSGAATIANELGGHVIEGATADGTSDDAAVGTVEIHCLATEVVGRIRSIAERHAMVLDIQITPPHLTAVYQSYTNSAVRE